MPNLKLLAWNMPPLATTDAIVPQIHLRLTPFGEGGDDTPPQVALVSLPVSANTPLVVDITDATVFRLILFSVRFPWLRAREVVYESGGFAELYAASFLTTLGNGFRFTVFRQGGWPDGGTIEFKVYAIDLDGNEA